MEALRRKPARSLWPVVVVSGLLLPGAAWSEEEPKAETAITPGSRIRLSAPTVAVERIEGTVIQMDQTSVSISAGDRASVSVPRESITRLEVNTGRHRQTKAGALTGAVIGAALGAAHPCFAMVGCDEQNAGAAALIYGLTGAGYGAIVGALIKVDRWTALPLDRVRVTPVATPGRGVGLSVSFSF
jgi:hypothetical protein